MELVHQVPGFRSGRRWKQVLAALGYALISFFVFGGILTGSAVISVIGLEALVGVLLATDAWGLRSRTPVLNSSNRRLAIVGWLILPFMGFIILALFAPPPTPPDPALVVERYQRGIAAANTRQWNEAVSELDWVCAKSRSYADACQQLDKVKRDRDDHLASLHASIDPAVKGNDWNVAVATLKEIVGIDPGYKSAKTKLEEVEKQRAAYLEGHLAKARELASANKWNEATQSLKSVMAIDLNYKGASNILADFGPQRAEWLEAEYARGIQDLAGQRWWDASQRFERVILTERDYKDVQGSMDKALKALYQPLYVVSDTSNWKASASSATGWTGADFADANWSSPVPAKTDSTITSLTDGKAEYVWASGSGGDKSYAYFRREIQLGMRPVSANIEMNADDKYTLYINGQKVGENSQWGSTEKYEVAKYLQPGRNVIAVEAYNDTRICHFVFSMYVNQQGSSQLAPVPPALTGLFFTPTPIPPTPTPQPAMLLAQLDATWSSGDWAGATVVLERIRQSAPASMDWKDKLYVAHFNLGEELLAKGMKAEAAQEFEQAEKVDPGRGEAQSKLLALTPTSTPAPPTATPRPQVPPEVVAYMNYMNPKFADLVDSIAIVSTQSNKAANNIRLIRDLNWQIETAVGLAGLNLFGEQIQKYEPVPPELKSIDDQIVSVGKDCVYIADQYAKGVDNLSTTNLDNATRRMLSAKTKLDRVTSLLKDLAMKYGVKP